LGVLLTTLPALLLSLLRALLVLLRVL